MIVYFVGQFIKDTPEGSIFDIQGCFSTEEKAIAACRDENYFYYPLAVDEELPHEQIRKMPVYPIVEV